MNFKSPLTLFMAVGISFLSSAAMAQQTYDAKGALADFSARPAFPRGVAAMWATAINGLVGAYVVKNGAEFQVIGKGKGETNLPPQVNLKDRPVYHEWVSSSQKVDVGLVAFFNLTLGKDTLTELTIKDLFSVTDGAIKSDDCAKNRPDSFSETTRYWCIAAVTLSSIETKTYVKTNKFGKGEVGIVTASGTFANDAGKDSTTYSASIVPYGPFVNGKLVPDEVASVVVKPGDGVTVVPKSMGNGPLMGLTGVTLTLPK